ncbi:relaxase/mobilization nuclease domain-containing protein [Staphylococcus pseudoxylosus]|uniref:relaxase/mobilization nuclease domain-containing protein n=1 Tax=Staphylococcus pseudoxylosus TaxID=2282419 RepID=UPI00398ABA73
MATAKISSTKSTARAINYAEKRAEAKSGVLCDVDYAKGAFKASRELYGKTDGNQGHVVIQSFKPGEVTTEQCNQLGVELAEKIASNHQVAVYTHNDTDHIHNHIVINAVNLETGKKFNNNKQALKNLRQANDDICQAHNLSIPNEQAEMRYTQAELEIRKKGQTSWKDEIRKAINASHATNLDELANDLQDHNIAIERITDKTITYRHLLADKKVRGSKLGDPFDKGGLEIGFRRQNQQGQHEQERQGTPRQDEPNQSKTRPDWDKFVQETAKLRSDRQSAEAARLAHEKARRDREKRERESAKEQSTVKKSRGFDFEL